MKIIIVCDLTCKLYTHIVVQNLRPQSDNNWDNWRDGCDVRITCVHRVLMLCSGTLLEGVP
jgi:hypothetical protein